MAERGLDAELIARVVELPLAVVRRELGSYARMRKAHALGATSR